MGSSQYTDTITLLQSHISLYWQEFEGGYLPPNLRLHGLANSIHQNSQARLRGFSDPHAHHLTGNTTLIQGLPITYSPHMYRVRNDRPQGGSLNSGPGQRGDSYGRCGNDSWTGWGGNSRFVGDYGDNRRPFLKGVQCAACGRIGHMAKQCDMLAMAICLKRYMKKDLSATLRDAAETEWLEKWRKRLDNPSSTPRQVMQTYVERLNMTIAGLDNEMDWSCWECEDKDASE